MLKYMLRKLHVAEMFRYTAFIRQKRLNNWRKVRNIVSLNLIIYVVEIT